MITFLQGDCAQVLKTLPEKSVHCCITSPPYYGLRDYGVDGQIGLEQSPTEYVERLVAVFREVRRVLRDDGTLWLNLGDSYATYRNDHVGGGFGDNTINEHSTIARRGKFCPAGLKMKDLIGIPWTVAFALRTDGWYLRKDIIWHKSNPMPESVTDRPTNAHEYLFLLTKQARYYYDAEAVREENADPTRTNYRPGREAYTEGNVHDNSGRKRRNESFQAYANGAICVGRNRRSVWTVATQPYSEAHFATYPPKLIEPCILAGTSAKGCCAKCGAGWERIIEKEKPPKDVYTATSNPGDGLVNSGAWNGGGKGSVQKLQKWLDEHPPKTVGWNPTCNCGSDVVPCVVLDPFSGAGTTAMVAAQNNRDAIGIELNPEYITMSEKRVRGVQPKLLDFSA